MAKNIEKLATLGAFGRGFGRGYGAGYGGITSIRYYITTRAS